MKNKTLREETRDYPCDNPGCLVLHTKPMKNKTLKEKLEPYFGEHDERRLLDVLAIIRDHYKNNDPITKMMKDGILKEFTLKTK